MYAAQRATPPMSMNVRVDVMISRNDRHAIWRAGTFQPLQGRIVFGRKSEIDEIAGDRDVIGAQRHCVGNEPVGHRALMHRPARPLPVEKPERTLGIPMTRRKTRHRRKMDIGKMGKRERCGH